MQTFNFKSGRKMTVAVFNGSKPANWNPSGRHYQISCDYFISPGNHKSFRFDFWDSYHNKVNNLPCDWRRAIASWAGDVFSGMDVSSVDDIAAEFGYDKPSEAIRVYRGLKHATTQYKRIEMSEEDLSELADY
jgi:hypothetical protein